jgi:hypothetical protein
MKRNATYNFFQVLQVAVERLYREMQRVYGDASSSVTSRW